MMLVWLPLPPLQFLKSESEDMLIVIVREASNLSQRRVERSEGGKRGGTQRRTNSSRPDGSNEAVCEKATPTV